MDLRLILLLTMMVTVAACGSAPEGNTSFFGGQDFDTKASFRTKLDGRALGRCIERCDGFPDKTCRYTAGTLRDARFTLQISERNAVYFNTQEFKDLRGRWNKLYERCYQSEKEETGDSSRWW